ncbi:MAG TPA: FAD-dependent oxidoreductase [Bacteriovoracaceae bacterium]|nr:FAD-dependent oxidoreductase [Bacteriovoracaceae bacterium]
MSFDRRSFLKTSMLFSAAGMGLFPKQSVMARDFISNDVFSKGPIETLKEFKGSHEFTGDHDTAGHEIFWDKEGFLKKNGMIPPPTKTYDVIVIGGGMAGLCSAYNHRNEKTLLIEGHPQMGGNSRAERYENLSMSLGAAYINIPEKNDPLDLFLNDLGLNTAFRREPIDEFSVFINGKMQGGFWNQGEDFKKVFNKFADIYENDYPELPIYPETGNREKLNQMDLLNFKQWIAMNLGEVHPHIMEFFHQYCWSSFCGSMDDLSAAQVVGFIASDLNGVQALPGGNAVVAEAIYNKLKSSKVSMLNNSFAVNVKNTGSDVEVTYFEDQKRLITVRAKKVVMAAPKLVTKFLIEDLAKEQHAAMHAMKYRAYLLVNVLLSKKVPSMGYDLFALKGKIPVSERTEIEERGFCDIIFADWANHDRADQSALTLYIPQPYEGAQQFLFSSFTYEKHRQRILNNLGPWFDKLGLTNEDVIGMRMSRYGHALPLARQGFIASGLVEKAHKTIDNAIFFAHSDNWANPCLETAFYSAKAAFI